MNAKRVVSIALVLVMVLTMVFTNAVFAQDEPIPADDQPFVGQPVGDTSAQADGGYEAVASVPETGVTRTVDQVNGPYKTISDAVAKADPGDTVLVKDGRYNEVVSINKQLKLVAENKWNQTAGTGAWIEDGIIIGTGAPKVTVQGFKISSTQRNAVSFLDGVENCTFTENYVVATHDSYALITTGVQKNNSITKNTFYGISEAEKLVFIGRQPDDVQTLSSVSIIDNYFEGVAEIGLQLEAKFSTVSGNTFNMNADEARMCVTAEGNTITNNTFSTLSGFDGVQFIDDSATYNLETIRQANKFEQAVYIKGGHKIYYYIQDGVDAARDLDEVRVGGDTYTNHLVNSGVYYERVFVNYDHRGHNDSYANFVLGNYHNDRKSISLKSIDSTYPDNGPVHYAAKIKLPTYEVLQVRDGFDPRYALYISGSTNIEGFDIQGMKAVDIRGSYIKRNRFGDTQNLGAFVHDSEIDTAKATTFELNEFTKNPYGGLYMEYSENVFLSANKFVENGIKPVPSCQENGTTGYGAYIKNTEDLRIESNYFNDNTCNGLILENITQDNREQYPFTQIKNNYFERNFKNGIKVLNSNYVNFEYNFSVTENKNYGAFFNNCANVNIVENNTAVKDILGKAGVGIVKNTYGGIFFGGTASLTASTINITNNLIDNNGSNPAISGVVHGGFIDNMELLTATTSPSRPAQTKIINVTGNTITFNKGNGVQVFKSTDVNVKNNTITDNTADGIEITNSVNDVIELNNILRNTAYGIWINVGTSNINNNTIQANGGGIKVYGDTRITYNQILSNNVMGGIDLAGSYVGFVRYNNIVGNAPFGLRQGSSVPAASTANFDKLGGPYSFNYWGNISGPIDNLQKPYADIKAGNAAGANKNLLGLGNAIENQRAAESVKLYAPWLSDEYDSNYGTVEGASPVVPYAVTAGWNVISTPLNLEITSWDEIKNIGVKQTGDTFSLDCKAILGYDQGAADPTKRWVQNGEIQPLTAYYINMDSVDLIPMVIRNGKGNGLRHGIQRDVVKGWSLVGPGFNYDTNSQTLLNATKMNRVLQAAQDGANGWQQVFHPGTQAYGYGRTQSYFETYTLTVATDNDPNNETLMPTFAGDWVYMNGNKQIAGEIFNFDVDSTEAAYWNVFKDVVEKILEPQKASY